MIDELDPDISFRIVAMYKISVQSIHGQYGGSGHDAKKMDFINACHVGS